MRQTLAVLGVLLVLLPSCNKLFPVDVGQSGGRGIVRRIDTVNHQVTLSHGTIQNLLHPMTYAYPVSDDNVMRGVKEGDTVSFTIEETKPGSFRVLSLKQIHTKDVDLR
jgi:Cu/Ag efflux protein CusF